MAKLSDNLKRRFSGRALMVVGGVLAGGLAWFAWASANGDSGKTSNGDTFKLREVSVFEPGHDKFLRGQMCRCQDQPFAEVKHYPAFASQKPIFGSVRFGRRTDDPNSGLVYYFAVDESGGTGKGYDRLYFDSNRDLDLRNDPVAQPRQPAPDHGYKPSYAGIKSVTAFDFLRLDLGANGTNTGTVEIMPRLLLTGDDQRTYEYMFFVRTRLFEGDIRMGGRKFKATLGNDFMITSALNDPGAALVLNGRGISFDWLGGDRLSAIHKLKGRFFTLSATPAGELTVRPYQGDLGTFEIGPGARSLTNVNLTVSGSFEARDWAVPVGGDITDGWPDKAARCQVPVGDYLPEYLTLRYGRLGISLSQNYHSEGQRQNRGGRPPVFGITIRKDQPYVLDFSNPPEVMFTSPTNGQRFSPGDTLMVTAVLVDPKLDIMIRRLDDTTRQTTDANGPRGYHRNVSLDPRVIITRANGEKVAEGVMPFG